MEQNRFIQRNKQKILGKDTVQVSETVIERCSVKKGAPKNFAPCLFAYH